MEWEAAERDGKSSLGRWASWEYSAGESMGACGGVFSSNCCCLAPLINSERLVDEEREGVERREVTKDDVEDEEEVVKCGDPEEMEAAAATAATLLSCRRECEIRAKSTLGAKGRVEGVPLPEAPSEKPAPPTSDASPHVSSSVLPFGLLGLLFMLLVPQPLDSAWPISSLDGPPNATPNKEGGKSESDSSGFCSRCRRKCTLRLPLVVNRLRHTGHWYGRSPVCERK